MVNLLRRMWNDEEGQDVAEYALMLAVVLVVAVAGAIAIGTNASATFTNAADKIK